MDGEIKKPCERKERTETYRPRQREGEKHTLEHSPHQGDKYHTESSSHIPFLCHPSHHRPFISSPFPPPSHPPTQGPLSLSWERKGVVFIDPIPCRCFCVENEIQSQTIIPQYTTIVAIYNYGIIKRRKNVLNSEENMRGRMREMGGEWGVVNRANSRDGSCCIIDDSQWQRFSLQLRCWVCLPVM